MRFRSEHHTACTVHIYSGGEADRHSIDVLMSDAASNMPDIVDLCSGTGHRMSDDGKFIFGHRYFLYDIGSDMRIYGHIRTRSGRFMSAGGRRPPLQFRLRQEAHSTRRSHRASSCHCRRLSSTYSRWKVDELSKGHLRDRGGAQDRRYEQNQTNSKNASFHATFLYITRPFDAGQRIPLAVALCERRFFRRS